MVAARLNPCKQLVFYSCLGAQKEQLVELTYPGTRTHNCTVHSCSDAGLWFWRMGILPEGCPQFWRPHRACRGCSIRRKSAIFQVRPQLLWLHQQTKIQQTAQRTFHCLVLHLKISFKCMLKSDTEPGKITHDGQASHPLTIIQVFHRSLLAEAVCTVFHHRLPAMKASLEAASAQLPYSDCSHICDFLQLPRPHTQRAQVCLAILLRQCPVFC